MTETGLLIAEVAFLVLLYLFIWGIVRASSRQLRGDPPPAPASHPPAPLIVPLAEEPTSAEASFEPHGPDAQAPETPLAPPAPLDADPKIRTAMSEPAMDAEPVEEPSIRHEADEAIMPGDGERALDLASGVQPHLVVEQSPTLPSGEVLDLTGGITIGRSKSSDLTLSDQFVSHMHARILRRGPYYFVEDLGSTNGTFINDRRVETPAQLRVRDVVRLGDSVLRYEE